MPQAARIRSLQFDENGKLTTSPIPPPLKMSDGTIRVVEKAIRNGEKVLTPAFAEVESFDFLESRGEVAFSARRDGGLDIGLVSSDGSDVTWVPADPADETGVQWAPRGSKISYVIRASGGDVVRTLHVPTSYQFSVPFPNATIHALAWDVPAERYAVAYSTPVSSDQVEVMKYSGEERQTSVAPAVTLDVEVEPFAPGALLLRPRELRYDEKVPLVVWIAEDFRWNDARAALLQKARVAVIVTKEAGAIWNAVAAVPWIDRGRTFVVSNERIAVENATLITADASLPEGHLRREPGNVLVVAPAVIQSVAAGFIADQLERTSPTNGSRR